MCIYKMSNIFNMPLLYKNIGALIFKKNKNIKGPN